LHRNRSAILLAALGVFILVDPHVFGSAISIAYLVVAIVALLGFAVSPYRRHRFWTLSGLLLLMAVGEVLVELQLGRHWMEPLVHAATALFTAGIISALLMYVLDRRPITADKVFGAVSAYVLIAVLFATLFSLLQLVQSNAFYVALANDRDGRLDWSGLMYFSFTVLTSTGFGEITPITHQARSLIVVEQVLGVMYVAFLIARLANMYQDERSKGANAETGE
jgi:hypothetical protein